MALLDADQRLLVRVENPDEHRGIAIRDAGRHNTLRRHYPCCDSRQILRIPRIRPEVHGYRSGNGFARQLFGDRETATEVWSRDEVLNRTRRVALLLA